MLVVPLVLGRDDGIAQVFGHMLGIDHAAEGLAAPGEDLAVTVKHRDRSARAGIDQVSYGGKLLVEVERGPKDDQRQHGRDAPADTPDDAPDQRAQPKDHGNDQPVLAGRGLARGGLAGRWCAAATLAAAALAVTAATA